MASETSPADKKRKLEADTTANSTEVSKKQITESIEGFRVLWGAHQAAGREEPLKPPEGCDSWLDTLKGRVPGGGSIKVCRCLNGHCQCKPPNRVSRLEKILDDSRRLFSPS